MSGLVATAHIGGALVTLAVLGILLLFIGQWETEKTQQRRLQAVAVQLGVSIERLEDEALSHRLVQLLADRASTELLRNRLADLCGIVQTLWGWVGGLAQWGILAGVIWFTVAESNTNSVFAWVAVATAVFFWLVSVAFSYLCLLLTGRFPGEPKAARKALVEHLKTQSAALQPQTVE